NCGHLFRLAADVWIPLIADRGSWQERCSDVRSHDLLNWTVPKPYQETVERLLEDGLNEAVRTGTCTLDRKPMWLAAFDFGFVGGTLSIVAGERLARGMEQAASSGTPYVLVSASGGARMQEGVLALMQLAKVNAAVGRLHAAGVPFFSVLTDPTFGGTAASLALLGDINIAAPVLARLHPPPGAGLHRTSRRSAVGRRPCVGRRRRHVARPHDGVPWPPEGPQRERACGAELGNDASGGLPESVAAGPSRRE